VQGQGDGSAGNHQEVDDGQVPELYRKQAPDLNAQRVPRVLDIPQHGRYGHDGKADPKEVEEAMEVAVVAVRIEVGYAARELDRGEESSALLGTRLLACRRE
jgi:hypothetical protein